ncbi:MAG: hypothetical protein VKJ02_13590 [Snowella sp.]|nr:hypothetical protein [Snowella sp.]
MNTMNEYRPVIYALLFTVSVSLSANSQGITNRDYYPPVDTLFPSSLCYGPNDELKLGEKFFLDFTRINNGVYGADPLCKHSTENTLPTLPVTPPPSIPNSPSSLPVPPAQNINPNSNPIDSKGNVPVTSPPSSYKRFTGGTPNN